MQTDEERQNALQAFSAQSTFSSSGSGSSMGPLPSPTSHSESRPKVRKGPRKNQNEKYQLKYMRLRKAARAMIFVSKIYFVYQKHSFKYVIGHFGHYHDKHPWIGALCFTGKCCTVWWDCSPGREVCSGKRRKEVHPRSVIFITKYTQLKMKIHITYFYSVMMY